MLSEPIKLDDTTKAICDKTGERIGQRIARAIYTLESRVCMTHGNARDLLIYEIIRDEVGKGAL